jgi:mannose-6-phosphate isomerase-like protein (cupin superfamily)
MRDPSKICWHVAVMRAPHGMYAEGITHTTVKAAAMPDDTPFDAVSLVASADTAAGFWQLGILWTPLISGESTCGAYSLMEQLMPAKAGPPPHVHDQGEEVFYILDGEMPLPLGDQVVIGTKGRLVSIPAGTPHAFAVKTATGTCSGSTETTTRRTRTCPRPDALPIRRWVRLQQRS